MNHSIQNSVWLEIVKMYTNTDCNRIRRSWGSSVSIESAYRLDDQEIKVWFPAEAKNLSSCLCVQTGSEAHPASYPMGTEGPYHGSKAQPVCDTDHPPPSSTEVKNELELYLLSPKGLHGM
jgi:hypothetical protein